MPVVPPLEIGGRHGMPSWLEVRMGLVGLVWLGVRLLGIVVAVRPSSKMKQYLHLVKLETVESERAWLGVRLLVNLEAVERLASSKPEALHLETVGPDADVHPSNHVTWMNPTIHIDYTISD